MTASLDDLTGAVQWHGVLGEGTFASVYGGLTTDGNCRRVAVKVTNDSRPRSRSAAEHEVKVLSRLKSHPNVITLLGMCQVSGNQPALVFERISSVPLYQGIARLPRYNEAVLKVVVRQLLSAVAFCHRNHVVHRDISPDNILWTTEPERTTFDGSTSPIVKIIDFNIAKVMTDGSKRCYGAPVGNPLYMSPEALLDRAVISPAADVWSLGVVFFFLMVGYLPFWDDNYNYLLQNIAEANYHLEARYWRRACPGARTLVSRMLRRRPEDRACADDLLSVYWLKDGRFSRRGNHTDWRTTQLRVEQFHCYHRNRRRKVDHYESRRAFRPSQDFEDLIQILRQSEDE